MKRREFFATPALSLVLPTILEEQAKETAQPVPDGVEQRMHPDFITYTPGIEYFYLGNGDIQGAIQYSPRNERQSLFGLTIMDPENFCRKWSTFLYHPERGFSNTRLGVNIGEGTAAETGKAGMYAGVHGFRVARENFRSIAWEHPDGVPVVTLTWEADGCVVTEEFFVPSEGAVLFRRVRVSNDAARPLAVTLSLSLYANFGLFTDIRTVEREGCAHASGLSTMTLRVVDRPSTVYGRYDVRADLGVIPAGASETCIYVYAIKGGERLLRRTSAASLTAGTASYWKARSTFVSGNRVVDQLYDASRAGLRAVIARSGRMDAGTWMYNMEWLGDHALASEALLRCGFREEARLLLERNLRDSLAADGRTMESGRWFGEEYTEINQNGIMLYALWNYLCWTGDEDLLRTYWKKIRLCGDYPLKPVFLDPQTHLVRNRREFWERSDSHGIQEGYELAYQFWVAFGLDRGARMAEALGDSATARRWTAAAEAMRKAMFSDPVFRFEEDGHLIKRRTRSGAWQKHTLPPDRTTLPPGSPIAIEEEPSLEPDAVTILPILYGMIDPDSPLSRETLRWVDALWNQRWEGGGYPRYNVSSEDNPPAPWPIPSMLIARASAAAGENERVWRVLEWLHGVAGRSGSWFERYGQSITPPMPPVGVVGWIWYEIVNFCSQQVAGVQPGLDALEIRPHLLDRLEGVTATHTIRGARVDLRVRRTSGTPGATVNGRSTPLDKGSLRIPNPRKGRSLTITMDV